MFPKKTALLIIAALAVTAWFFHGGSSQDAGKEASKGGFGVPVETAKVETAVLAETVQSVGTLVAEQGVMVRPEVAGVVAEVLFTEGQQVKAGQPLLRLEDSIQRAQLALARRTDSRATNLVGRGAGTAQAADEASAGLQVAQAALNKMLITAPFAGTVGIRQVSLGDYVSPGQDLVTVQALDPLKVDFHVPDSELSRLAVGQKVALQVNAYPEKTFAGDVVAIDPLVDAAGRSVALRARVPNPEGVLRPGLFATVTLTVGEKPDSLFVPATAITPMGGQQFVFRLVDGKATLTPVQIGVRQSGRVQVAQGLATGDEVVTAGQIKLMMMGGAQNPLPVTVLPAPAAPQAEPKATPEPQAKP